MKLKDYVQNLVDLMEDNPEFSEYEVIYSHDDEGNAHQLVDWMADEDSIGHFEGKWIGDWISKADTEYWNECDVEANAIVVN